MNDRLQTTVPGAASPLLGRSDPRREAESGSDSNPLRGGAAPN